MQEIHILVSGPTAEASLSKKGAPWAEFYFVALSGDLYSATRTNGLKGDQAHNLCLRGFNYCGTRKTWDALFVVLSKPNLSTVEIKKINQDIEKAKQKNPEIPVVLIFDNLLNDQQRELQRSIAEGSPNQDLSLININSQDNNYGNLDAYVSQQWNFTQEQHAVKKPSNVLIHKYNSCALQYKKIGLFAGTGSVAMIGLGIMGIMNLTSLVIGAILISAAVAALCLVLYKTDCWATHTVAPASNQL